MKNLIILLFICAAGVVSCGKKIMPESDANNQSRPVNDKEAKSATQSANTSSMNTNSQDNGLPSFGNVQKSATSMETKAMVMDKGKTLYTTKCTACHAPKTPNDYTTDQMKNILKVEIPKAKLDNKEAEQVTTYLLANTRK